MPVINVEVPEEIILKYNLSKEISYENFIIKTIGKEYISPDLSFTSYKNMKDSHKKEFDKLENIDKSKLCNI